MDTARAAGPRAEPEQAARPSMVPFWAVLAAGFAAIAVYYFLPAGPGASTLYEGIGAASAAAILWGRRRHRPTPSRAWTLIAVGVFLWVLADVTWAIYEFGLNQYPDGSLADVFYLAGYPFFAAGVLSMVRAKTSLRDREALVDAAIFTVGVSLVTWQVFIRPSFSQPGMSTFGIVAAIAYPLADILIMAVMLRMLLIPGSRVPAFWLVFGSLALTLIGDEFYAAGSGAHILDVFWLGAYVLTAGAALHPSMRSLTQRASGVPSALGLLRLVLLVVSLVAAIAVLIPGHPDSTALVLTAIFAVVVLARVAFVGRTADRIWKHQQAAEALLREAEMMYRTLVERLPAVTYVEVPDSSTSLGYRDTYVSPQVAGIFGISVQEWMADTTRWHDILHPDDRDRVLAIMDDSTVSGVPYKVEYRVIPKPGDITWIRDEAFRVLDEDGRLIRWQGFAYDITEEKAAEQAVLAREVAERANAEKSAFLSRVSHELRTPLNAILGFGQLLEMENLSPSQTESVGQIMTGGLHLLELVNELLEISNIESGQRKPSLESVVLGPLVAHVLDLMAPVASATGVRLRQDASSPPGVCVTADEQTLRQVLLNLVSNGIKFNRSHGEVSVSWDGAENGTIGLLVSDTGIGIPEDKMDLLWAPFERLGAEQAGIPGTGLGLTLALRQVEAMGSSLTVESAPGVGSTFKVELPMAEHPADRLVELLEPEEGTNLSESAAAAVGPALSILCIEDNPANLRLMEKIVSRRTGTSLVTAMQGGIGMQLALERTPDIIMLDLHLPDIPGEECLRTLKEDPRTCDIPVIIVTADAGASVRKSLQAAGAAYFVSKPIDIDNFLHLLDEIQGQLVSDM